MLSDSTNNTGPNRPEDALTEQEIEAYCRQFDEFARDFQELAESLQPRLEQQLLELAGPHLERMRRSPEDALRYLTDPDPRLREAGLRVAYRYWNITHKIGPIYEKLATQDPDADVREAAVGAIGTCYARMKDPRIGRLLAEFVLDERLTESIRLTAFTSLLRLHGNMEYGVDYGGKSPLVPTSLEQVDWGFVDCYYRGWPDRGESR